MARATASITPSVGRVVALHMADKSIGIVSENVVGQNHLPVRMLFISLSLLSASIGVRLLMSHFRISSRT